MGQEIITFQGGGQTPKIQQVIRQGTQCSEGMAWVAAVTVTRVGKKKTNVLILQIGTQSIHMLFVATVIIITPSAYGGLSALPGSVLKSDASGN